MSEDFYSVLGVSRDADTEEIKQAYRKKAAEYHPDVSDDPDAEEKFKQIKKAKEVLTDDEKRRMYDQMGHDRFVEAEKHGATDAGAGGVGGAGARGDPFGGAGGGIGDIFEQFFGGGGGRRSGPRQGADLRTELTIDLEDAYHGVEKQVTVRRPETCPSCDGEGHPPSASARTCPECGGRGQVTQVQRTPLGRVQQRTTCRRCEGEGTLYSESCSECGGEGRVRREATLQVEVPAGIEDGQTLRMEREGAAGEAGAPRGDLLIEVTVEDHPDFERDGADLYRQQAISFPQAVFGDTVTVETVDGTVEMEVPAGTQSGERFRLQGKGMPHLRRRGYGNLYVVAQVVTPEPDELDDSEREALETFADAGGQEVDTDVGGGFFDRIRESL
ncbi:molecular chaperone DnaJ [Halobacteriales archaeon QS_1_68_20]|nr:MAG: molecular chaperone DnaJ [Halobacteriales archaeon QS_1_68_20]